MNWYNLSYPQEKKSSVPRYASTLVGVGKKYNDSSLYPPRLCESIHFEKTKTRHNPMS